MIAVTPSSKMYIFFCFAFLLFLSISLSLSFSLSLSLLCLSLRLFPSFSFHQGPSLFGGYPVLVGMGKPPGRPPFLFGSCATGGDRHPFFLPWARRCNGGLEGPGRDSE